MTSSATPHPGAPAVRLTEHELQEEIEEELEERPAGTGSLIIDLLKKLYREVSEVKDGIEKVDRKVDDVDGKVGDLERKINLLTNAYQEHARQLGVLTTNCLKRAENCPAIGTGEHSAIEDPEPSPT